MKSKADVKKCCAEKSALSNYIYTYGQALTC